MRRPLAARCLELLGPVAGRVVIVGPRAAPDTGAPAGAAIVSFLGAGAGPAARQALIAGLRATLPPGAPLVLVDHNQPRVWWRRGLGVAALALRGLPPSRARYPAARELAALGLRVERLRLACGERVQLVVARWEGAVELVLPAASK